MMRRDPVINNNEFPLDAGIKYGIDADEFMIAIAAENYETGAFLSDSRFVRFVTAVWEKKNDELSPTWYPMHACNEEEFSRFESPTSEFIASKVQRM